MEREEMQGMLNELMLGISDMFKAQKIELDKRFADQEKKFDEKLEKNKSEILAYIENGVEKNLQVLTEHVVGIDHRLDRMEKRQDAMEEQLGRLTEDMQVVKAAVASHADEIITLKRIK